MSRHGDGPDALAVTFDHWGEGKRGFSQKKAHTELARRGFTHLHVSTSQNDWFLNPEMPEALLKIADFAEPFARKLTIAFSMGGFGALLVSRVVAFDQLLLVSPHSTYSNAFPPHDDRFSADILDEGFARTAHDMVHSSLKMDAECVVVFDSTRPFDEAHARMSKKLFTRSRLVDLRGGGHPATGVLRAAKRYNMVLEAAIGHGIDETAFVDAHYQLLAVRRSSEKT